MSLIIYYIQGGVVELLFDDCNSTWYDRQHRAWYEGEREPLEKRYVFVSKSREENAGEGLFLNRRVYWLQISMMSRNCRRWLKGAWWLTTLAKRDLGKRWTMTKVRDFICMSAIFALVSVLILLLAGGNECYEPP